MASQQPNAAHPSVLVIGGVVMDIVYTANPSANRRRGASKAPEPITASRMVYTSTPCNLTRQSMGGVGRNIAEALGRLGISTWMLSVVGGVRKNLPAVSLQGQQESPISGEPQRFDVTAQPGVTPGIMPDAYGYKLLEELYDLTHHCSWEAPPVHFVVTPVPGARTATYTALIGSDGELAAASADMSVLDEALTPGVLRLAAARAILTRMKGVMSAREFNAKMEEKLRATERNTTRNTCGTETKRPTPIPTEYEVLLDDVLNIAATIDVHRGIDMFPPQLVRALLTSIRWVVTEGNVPSSTVVYVARILLLARSVRELLLRAVTRLDPHDSNHYSTPHGSYYPLMVHDPTSVTKCVRVLPVLPVLTVLKPNLLEATELATFLVLWRHIVRTSLHDSKRKNKAFCCPYMDILQTTNTKPTECEKSFWADFVRTHYTAAVKELPLPVAVTAPLPFDSSASVNTPGSPAAIQRDELEEYVLLLTQRIARLLIENALTVDGAKSTATNFLPVSAEGATSIPDKRQHVIGRCAATILVEIGGVYTVLCSLGKEGCYVAERCSGDDANVSALVRFVPALVIPGNSVIKVTGAGDSFLSGYLYGLLTGMGPATHDSRSGRRIIRIRHHYTQDEMPGVTPEIVDKASYAERCALHAAVSALQSPNSVINPAILQYVQDQWVTPPLEKYTSKM